MIYLIKVKEIPYEKIQQLHLKGLIGVLTFLVILCMFFLISSVNSYKAFAESDTQNDKTANVVEDNGEASPRGLYTNLSLSINGGNSKIWATVKNDLTLFTSTVTVIVELYSSNTCYESHTNMNFVSINSIEDLDMGHSIVAECHTGGVQKYWQARMRYNIDNGGWQSKTTGTMLYSAEGKYLGLL